MRIVVLFSLILLTALPTFAGDDNSHEVGIAIGAANFLGDLGGANKIGTPFLRDIEPRLFRPDINVF